MSRSFLRVAGLSALLALAACTPSAGTPRSDAPSSPANTATPSAAAASPGGSQTAGTPVVVRDFELDPKALSVSGSTVSLAVTNEGPTVHNVTVRDAAGKILFGTPDLREGESGSATGTLEPGTYVMFCSLAGHESLGIKGELTVTAP